jgi:hypothetical protein
MDLRGGSAPFQSLKSRRRGGVPKRRAFIELIISLLPIQRRLGQWSGSGRAKNFPEFFRNAENGVRQELTSPVRIVFAAATQP